ncbi:unnamed protein product [Prunus armeniaca]
MLVELGIQSVEILGDSMLVLKQIAGEYKCLSPSLAVYPVAARNLLTEFREATWEHIPREENFASNELAQVATGKPTICSVQGDGNRCQLCRNH